MICPICEEPILKIGLYMMTSLSKAQAVCDEDRCIEEARIENAPFKEQLAIYQAESHFITKDGIISDEKCPICSHNLIVKKRGKLYCDSCGFKL